MPFREAASQQRELNAEEPVKVKELNTQITELEDTRDIQAALIEELETKITTVEAEALEFKGKVGISLPLLLQNHFGVISSFLTFVFKPCVVGRAGIRGLARWI